MVLAKFAAGLHDPGSSPIHTGEQISLMTNEKPFPTNRTRGCFDLCFNLDEESTERQGNLKLSYKVLHILVPQLPAALSIQNSPNSPKDLGDRPAYEAQNKNPFIASWL